MENRQKKQYKGSKYQNDRNGSEGRSDKKQNENKNYKKQFGSQPDRHKSGQYSDEKSGRNHADSAKSGKIYADSVKSGRNHTDSGKWEKKHDNAERKPGTAIKKGKASCPVADKCGGCQYQGVPYDKQLKKKQKQVEMLLGELAPVRPITGMKDPLHYRNKVHAVFHYTKKHELISGIYEENSHRVIPVDECEIEDKRADAIIRDIRGLLPSFKIKAYDEDTGYGLFRHVLIRTGYYTGQILVVLVLSSPILPSRNNFVKALLKLHPEITSIVINVNNRSTSMVLGDKETVIYGKGYIEDTIGDCTFRISPKSFYQVNPVQTQNLYGKALELADLTGNETVIDAYCGTGTIGILAAAKAKEVIGVELNHDAVKDAIINARTNNRKNIRFYEKDAGEFLVQMASQGGKADVLIMDPPRAGSSEEFIRAIGVMKPEKVVYVSCNPETLARDVKLLGKQGYQAKEFWPYDMFPLTSHVETVVLLSKGVIDSQKVKVDFSLENMDITSFRGKATYEQIKEYVLQQTGMKVSSLYISQIKRKCGLEVGDSYNRPKTEDAKQPQCPPEKEAAIMNALKHFGLI